MLHAVCHIWLCTQTLRLLEWLEFVVYNGKLLLGEPSTQHRQRLVARLSSNVQYSPHYSKISHHLQTPFRRKAVRILGLLELFRILGTSSDKFKQLLP
jgi:hypothetical protein